MRLPNFRLMTGGTSLSKGYHLISRFSEDIDLILDWRVLAETFCPQAREGLSAELGLPANLYIDEEDKQTVIFAYPNLFSDASTLQVIRLEIGALAVWTPAELVNIVPYAAEQYPQLFKQKEVSVLTVAPERTFWEKATILHHEANRPEHFSMPQWYSRHYYDLYCMAKSPVKEKAFAQLGLLQKVVDFKIKFYPRAWAHYPEAVGELEKEIHAL